jgi:Flp pilus assembly pilin Flp
MEKEILTEGTVARKKQDKGVTTIEYAIMLVLIAIAVAIASPNVKSAVIQVFSTTGSVLK